MASDWNYQYTDKAIEDFTGIKPVVEEEIEEQMKLIAKESKLSMDMMYACCLLSKGTAIALKNNHFNSEVDEGIKLVDKTTEAYNKFLRETAADSMNQ